MLFLPLLFAARSQAPLVPVEIRLDRPGPAVPKSLFGVFFEEINHAGDGGLNAELVRNFDFSEPPASQGRGAPGWKAIGAGVDSNIGGAALTRAGAATTGIENDGYWGVSIAKGERYAYAVSCQSPGETPISLRLESGSGALLAEAAIRGGEELGEYKGFLVPNATDAKARLVVRVDAPGTVELRSVSLKPARTFDGHGLRLDLAQKVAAMDPAFVRFPGGCYVEGGDYLANRFQWEATLPPPQDRHGHLDAIWHYWSTDALGFREYLQWCEDMGAQALFVVNAGFSHQETVPLDRLAPYVDSALDALEYALGPTTTRYGAMRAAQGHPKPYPLKYVEIGNENGMGWTTGGSPAEYAAHYKAFAEEIARRYPRVVLIADNRAPASAALVDDHFYASPDWFWDNARRYDAAPRSGPKVYVGEYAVTQGCGLGNLRAALAEAAFMTGLERDSDVVRMASYAPLFVNAADRAWNPDAIVFDGAQAYGTPSYQVQRLFARARPDVELATEAPQLRDADVRAGGIGLGTWQTSAEFKDVAVSTGPLRGAWRPLSGAWTNEGGVLRQTGDETEVRTLFDDPALARQTDYTVSLKARKLGGAEGFLVLFRVAGDHRFLWWNIGGWGDTQTGVEETRGSARSAVGERVPFTVETGRWYDLKIVAAGDRLSLWVDGKLIQTVRQAGPPTLAVVAGKTAAGELIVKLVNGAEVARRIQLRFVGGRGTGWTGTATTLTSASLDDENTFAEPNRVAPATAPIALAGSDPEISLPPRALVILKLKPAP